MTFPEEADIEFFEKAKRIQELWEPKQGDLCVFLNGWGDKGRIMLIAWKRGYRFRLRDWGGEGEYIGNAKQLKVEFTWLPRQGQLREMLEKRANLSWVVGRVGDDYPDPRLKSGVKVYYASLLPISEETVSKGPTPSIALGKCLLEVLDKERLEDMDMWIGEDIEEEIKRQFPNG